MEVIFRIEKGGEVLAVFPFEIWSKNNYSLTGYAHNGQHVAADWLYIRDCTRPASEADAAPLLAELRAIGYDDLTVKKRLPSWGRIIAKTSRAR